MKIVHKESGNAYQLDPGTRLEIERLNPYLSDYGEQSLPVTLPDTALNRELTGYPEQLANLKKPSASIDCMIEDGEYVLPCRQAILGAKREEGITTSFYMNEGSFYTRLNKVSLKEVFGDETVPDVDSVSGAIDFCRSLLDGSNAMFMIFPIMVANGSNEDGSMRYKLLNRYDDAHGTMDFYNAQPVTESVDDTVVTLPAGCDMTPFVRANYLLSRILAHFGYTLKENFFTKTEPFTRMVLLNNTADAIVNGTIRLVQLLPDCTCNEILNVFRKRFCCEFIPDEVNKTVDIILFNDVLSAKPTADLSDKVLGHVGISYPEAYKQIRLVNGNILDDDNSGPRPDTLADLFKSYPTAKFSESDGLFYRSGFSFRMDWLVTGAGPLVMSESVGSESMPYQADGIMETEEVEMPDLLPEMRFGWYGGNWWVNMYAPYVGQPRYLNSTLTPTGDTAADGSERTQGDSGTMYPMLCFGTMVDGYPFGTTGSSCYDSQGQYHRLWEYALHLNGEFGIFEKFYRKYDDLLRNSLHVITAQLLLDSHLKVTLPSYLPVIISGQRLLPRRMVYQLGGKDEPLESEFVTLQLCEPVTSAKAFNDYIAPDTYRMVGRYEVTEITSAEYDAGAFKADKDMLYPTKVATAAGQVLAERTCFYHPEDSTKYYRIHYWIESTAI